MAHVCLHSRKRVHTRLSEKDRTQRLARRNRGLPSLDHSAALCRQRNTLYSATLLYTYISRFSVNPHYQQGEKIRQNCRHSSISNCFLTSRANGHVCFHRQKRVHTRLRQQDRTQGLTRRNTGVSDGGGIFTLGAFHTFRKPCVAKYQNGKLCRFWVLAGCTPEERRKPAEQRCAHACRCSEASRPRWAA